MLAQTSRRRGWAYATGGAAETAERSRAHADASAGVVGSWRRVAKQRVVREDSVGPGCYNNRGDGASEDPVTIEEKVIGLPPVCVDAGWLGRNGLLPRKPINVLEHLGSRGLDHPHIGQYFVTCRQLDNVADNQLLGVDNNVLNIVRKEEEGEE